MYQRLAMAGDLVVFSLTVCSANKVQHRRYQQPDELIRDQEEHRGDRHHYEDHHSGDRGLATRRPGDLLRLVAHLLHELEYVCLSHALITGRRRADDGYRCRAPVFQPSVVRLLSSVLCPWQEWRDSNPQPPVLETGALAS